MDETIELRASSQWELRDGIPYIDVRDGLYARLGRSVLYNLIESCGERMISAGKSFKLGDT